MRSCDAAHWVAAACCLVAGCSDLAPVAGTVYLDDRPLPEATISFVSPGSVAAPSSTTDAEGRFVVTTRKYGDGIRPGTYKVTVFKTKAPPENAVAVPQPVEAKPGEPPKMPATGMAAMVEQLRRNRAFWGIPAMYWQPNTTPVEVEIPRGGNKNLEIHLESKPAAAPRS